MPKRSSASVRVLPRCRRVRGSAKGDSGPPQGEPIKAVLASPPLPKSDYIAAEPKRSALVLLDADGRILARRERIGSRLDPGFAAVVRQALGP